MNRCTFFPCACARAQFECVRTCADAHSLVQPGSQLSVAIPGRGQVLLDVPRGLRVGQQFLFQMGPPEPSPRVAAYAGVVPRRRMAKPTTQGLKDLTFDGMLDYERKIRCGLSLLVISISPDKPQNTSTRWQDEVLFVRACNHAYS